MYAVLHKCPFPIEVLQKIQEQCSSKNIFLLEYLILKVGRVTKRIKAPIFSRTVFTSCRFESCCCQKFIIYPYSKIVAFWQTNKWQKTAFGLLRVHLKFTHASKTVHMSVNGNGSNYFFSNYYKSRNHKTSYLSTIRIRNEGLCTIVTHSFRISYHLTRGSK